ncbi:sensor histidine kinase [Paenibacillus piri]|uniref:histidine kinase n=1 Tax=Paenibacillus piri TaxID=2547395 RepID=A0A4R5KY46_9BACL|nr:sensor histidine kinase [Paenibacillus piri]TDG00149.1 two-component sensor histidine kinase [Paenibacillus piri]
MNNLKDIILQLFFALAPFVAYNIYYRDKLRNYSRSFIILVSSACLLLSMAFSSSVVDGIFFDIRYVIIFFGIVYGGIETALILLFEFVVCRIYVGGEGMWVGIFITALIFLISLIINHVYQTSSRRSLVIFTAGLIFSILPYALTFAFYPHYVIQHLAFHIIVIPVQNSLGVWLLMSLFSKSVADKELYIKHAYNQRRDTMNQVAASLAHEVRNPLTAVKGFLKLIGEKPQDPHKIKEYIGISMEEIQKTESVLREYLFLSQPPAVRREAIDFSEQLRVSAEGMASFAAVHEVELEVRRPDLPVWIVANDEEMKQVLTHFIKNAVEACSGVPYGKAVLTLLMDKTHAVLTIKDNGSGMNEEQISRLGSIYFSTKSNGTGLGLTYSYQVIHAIGGDITVTSKPLVGTRFTIRLPLRYEE